jgi:hypothetical protein
MKWDLSAPAANALQHITKTKTANAEVANFIEVT